MLYMAGGMGNVRAKDSLHPCHGSVSADSTSAQVRMPAQPDAYEFSIKTPVTPARWAEYDAVRAVVFDMNDLI
jgi:hypothetical protein